MQKKLQIVFRGIDQSNAVEEAVHKKVDKLERQHDRITSCRVVLDAPHKHHHKGKLFQVTINVATPEGDVSVHDEQEDLYVSIKDAFAVTGRQLTENHEKGKRYLRSA
jgi:ribosomal subunit interface protein